LLVLGAALAAGVALSVVSQADVQPPEPLVVVAEASAADLVRTQATPDAKPAPPEPPGSNVDAEISIGEKGVIVKRRRGGEPDVVVGDHEFDSFEQFVEKAPWLAGLVFMVTALAFLVPLLVIVLVIWYKMRSNRLRNETMLKLAERGVVAPAAAIDAVGSSATLQSAPATAPLYEQAKAVQRKVAWSDLRKGVILIGIGLGIALWSLIEEGSANGFALVLLFVGIGYTVLWFFEDRQRPRGERPPDNARGGA
jgi:membrane protein implicated in regulation of membrane protease activity